MNNKELLTEKGYSQYAEYWVKTMGYVNEKVDYRTYEVRIYDFDDKVSVFKIPYLQGQVVIKKDELSMLQFKGYYKNTEHLKEILDYYNL